MPNGMTINPNQPRPVVLASDVCPPPLWPLPAEDWVVLPVVPAGFPTGPFPPQVLGPISDGSPPVFAGCPGTGIASPLDIEPAAIARRVQRREEREERREHRRLTRGQRAMDRVEDREERREERRERE